MDTPGYIYFSYPLLITNIYQLVEVYLTGLDRDSSPATTITNTFIASLGLLKGYVDSKDEGVRVQKKQRQNDLDDLAEEDTIAQNEWLAAYKQQRQAVRAERRARTSAAAAAQLARAQQAQSDHVLDISDPSCLCLSLALTLSLCFI
ncbi:hypothetical protein Scep_007220 [Stephania cephalantha]|uniref:Uncharacterized protein n=1 Tax=Stephania cephalantha TaxID=152367 RepID=A0AAP0PKW1_9MAGN